MDQASFISQLEKKKTEVKDVQPAWMEGRNNRMSQGFGLAAAVAAAEIKSQRGANIGGDKTRDVSIRNYVQMIEAEEFKM